MRMIQGLESYGDEIDEDYEEWSKYSAQLETQNVYLRKLLGVKFTDDQLDRVQRMEAETEYNFFDNFCISRRDLEKKAIEEYEVVLGSRKNKIEKQFVDWHVQFMNEQ